MVICERVERQLHRARCGSPRLTQRKAFVRYRNANADLATYSRNIGKFGNWLKWIWDFVNEVIIENMVFTN
jgi:hypothetical protein